MFLFWAMSQSYQNIWSLTFKWPHVGFLKTIQSEWTLSLGYLVAKHDRHRCSYTRQATLLFCREWKYKKGIAFFSEARRWGNTVHFVGMKCPSCYTFSPIDSTFRGPSPSNLYPLVLAQWRPLPSVREEAQLPPLYPGVLMVTLKEGQLPSLIVVISWYSRSLWG